MQSCWRSFVEETFLRRQRYYIYVPEYTWYLKNCFNGIPSTSKGDKLPSDYDDKHGDGDFAKGDSGASLTVPVQCSGLKKGGHVNIKDRPCKIVDIHSSKVGKHGHSKVTITGIDVINNKRYQTVHPSSHNMDVPIVTRTDYILVDVGQYMSLMDDKGILRYDLPVPDGDIGKAILDKMAANTDETIEVTVLSAMGEEIVINVKAGK